MKGKATPRKVASSSSTTNKTLRKRSKVDYAMSSESEYFQKDKKKASGDSSSASFCNFSDDEDDFETPSKTPRRKSTSSKELRRRNLDVAEHFQDTGESSRVAKRGTWWYIVHRVLYTRENITVYSQVLFATGFLQQLVTMALFHQAAKSLGLETPVYCNCMNLFKASC